MDPQTGECIVTKKEMVTVSEDLVTAITDDQEGTFKPDRENGELTRALGNPEHPGRTRGKVTGVSWKTGFSECNESYRSRDRKKKKEAYRIQKIETRNDELARILKQQ